MSTIPSDCVSRLAQALGDKAKKADIQRVQEDLNKLALQAALDGVPSQDVLADAASRYARNAEIAVLVEKRNAALNAMRFAERLDYVRNTWKGREEEGLRAILTGSIEARKGARASVALEQKALTDQYFWQITTELERSGHMDAFRSGALDREVSKALWEMNTDSPRMDGISKDAQAIAKAIHRAQEVARSDANAAGAWIGKERGYITRQSHDPWKLAKRGQQAWVDDISPRLDWGRMEAQHGPIKDRAAWLAETYTNLVTGLHLKAPGAVNTTGFRGPGNIAKKMSAERVLHFKDADSWMGYNEGFGAGNLRESVFNGLRMSAQNTGIMRVLGPNPEALYNRLVDTLTRDVRASGNTSAINDWNTATKKGGWLSSRLDMVTGESNQAVDQIWARRSANLRAIQSMAKLGQATISSVADLAFYGAEMSYQGRGFLSGVAEGIGSLVKGRPTGQQREILSSLGVFFDSMIGDITRTGSLDETMGGGIARAQQRFFKWNLLSWWTETMRSGAALSMSHHLAISAGKPFDALSPDLKRTLSLFDIGARDWDIMRAKGLRTDEGGTSFVVTDNLPQEQARKLRQYIIDRAETAVLEPDADSRAMLQRGTKPGTITGELWRFMAQFKGFPMAAARQVMGREVYGYGEKAFADGSIRGISQLIVASLISGYAAMTIKDLLKGRTARDPRDPETLISAFMQGGGAGIYGDFLLGEYNRFGQSPAETLAGPALGTGFDVMKLWSKMVRGDADAGDVLRLAQNNTPYINLFYTRMALDYLILYDMQEAIAPGTLRRMERRAEQERGQTFLLPPSTERARPFTN